MCDVDQKKLIEQFKGEKIDTFCKRCKKKRTFKFYEDGSYTILCKCGCEIFRYYEKDQFHEKPFYTRNFVSIRQFNQALHDKKGFEKLGFTDEGEGKWSK